MFYIDCTAEIKYINKVYIYAVYNSTPEPGEVYVIFGQGKIFPSEVPYFPFKTSLQVLKRDCSAASTSTNCSSKLKLERRDRPTLKYSLSPIINFEIILLAVLR